MDQTAWIFVVIGLIVISAFIVGYWYLARKKLALTIFCIAFVLYAVSFSISEDQDRITVFIIGILRMCGFIGIGFGIAALRKKKASD